MPGLGEGAHQIGCPADAFQRNLARPGIVHAVDTRRVAVDGTPQRHVRLEPMQGAGGCQGPAGHGGAKPFVVGAHNAAQGPQQT